MAVALTSNISVRTGTIALALLLFCVHVLLIDRGLRKGTFLRLQRALNPERHIFLSRFDHVPWPLTNQTAIVPRDARRNRVFISAIPTVLGDGLGHRFAMVNFEMLTSSRLNLGYAHRQSVYGSITPVNDLYAVERLFGWAEGVDFRSHVLRRSCARIENVSDGCRSSIKNNIVCKVLKTREKGGEFDRLVVIPPSIIDCFLDQKMWTVCQEKADEFMANHTLPNTMFQMTPSKCHLDYRSGFFRDTGDFIRKLYWDYHAKYGTTASPPGAGTEKTRRTAMYPPHTSRTLSLSPKQIQIAVHVRRGDFFNFTYRQMIPDVTYADVICEIKTALDDANERATPVTVNIYSEGIARNGYIRNNHDVRAMAPVYATERGEIAKDGHWDQLIARRMRSINGSVAGVQTKLHIASDTVQALHDMIAADFFVGSMSGMSTTIVQTYARGIVVLPMKLNEAIGMGEKDRYLQYTYTNDNSTGILRRDKLEKRVAAAVDMFKLREVR